MIPDELITVISKFTSQLVEQVTCIECCKYYIAPETAACGHTLCHGCWSGRRTCPVCASSLDRRALRLNIPMQMVTEHIHGLGDAFESLFNIKLDDFLLDMPDEIPSNTDPTKNVKEWLASSQNEFSAPATALSSQLSTQDLGHPVFKSKTQIHTHTKKSTSPPKIICAPPCQEDWDKIETLPDKEDIKTKNKENIIDPMDLEPFSFDDYSTENPRRSSRKRDYKNESNPNPQVRDASADKHSSKNSSTEAEKKSTKVKQNWSNVKKMRKEFSKLNKINRSKLNVSIEMCKRAQNTNKPKESPVAVSQQAAYVIDDNTPDVMNNDKEKISIKKLSDGSFRTETKTDEKHASNNISKINEDFNEPHKLSDNSSKSQGKEKNDDIITSHNDNNHKESTENLDDNVSLVVKDKPLLVDQSISNNCSKVSGQEIEKNSCLPFIKKSALRQKSTEDNCVQIIQNEIESNANTDDIEISIKIGNTITNILIKKKQDDVQLKVNTDREIQTSLGPYSLPNKQDASCSPFKEVNVVNLQLNIDGNKVQKVTPVIKTVSTKINTDSADTATANFEITDSVEKEISDVMDCIEIDNAVNKPVQNLAQVSKTPSITKSKTPSITKSPTKDLKMTNTTEIEEDEDLNDMDIFESDSVKETNVQLLKNTKYAPSEIIQTMISKKSQRVPDKRDRDVNEETEMPSNKKLKIDEDKSKAVLHEITENDNNINIANDSESMSYDKILGQVFENIDADNKSQNTIKSTQKNNKPSNTTIQSQCSQIIHKTQKTKSMLTQKRIPPPTSNTQEHINQKFSENVFSMVEKDNESHSEMRKDNSQLQEAESVVEIGDNTQAEVEELEMEHILGTPVVENDDSDKSVVEETPQKNMSFTKLKSKQDVTKQNVKDTDKPQPRSNSENPPAELKKQATDSQIIKSIINISDASEENTKTTDTTVVEITKKISVLETPLTINKFVNHIKHNSTPVARKSLNFESEIEDPEQTLCPTTTQEKEFLTKAFEQTPNSPIKRPLGLKNARSKENQKLCIAGSCLTSNELVNVKLLCHQRGWTYVDKYTKDLTHLVVGVDEENKSQRSVKYMCALAASKWIVSYNWVEKCLKIKQVVDELPYEVLDGCGDPGPRQSRIAQRKLFEGIKFYCMPPFSVLDLETLKYMLEAAGGCVVEEAQGVRVADGAAPALLLAEPEHTQEDRFMYLAMELSIVPVNYEWVLNCLGTYSLGSLHELLLCPSSLLHPATGQWPASLLMRESNEEL